MVASKADISFQTPDFVICGEEQKYRRYLTLYNRRVRFPAYKDRQATEHDFDIIGHPQADFHFSAVFPFHPAGGGQPAEAELEGGEWVELLGPGHPGIAEVKWCANRFTPFLCIGPCTANTQGKQDAEEFIEVKRISIPALKEVLRSGNMLLPSVTTSYFAMEELQKRGLL